MAERTSKYNLLEARIDEIINHFSFDVDPIEPEPPTDKEEDMIRAMIVLSHAEFESYIEGLALELIAIGESRWGTEGVANKNIASLFLNTRQMNSDDKPQARKMDVRTFSTKILKEYKDYVTFENHGIKRKNVEKMYTPLGYEMDSFDQAFLNDVEAFGKDRGKVAHSSSSTTRSMLDFNTEKTKIKQILAEIKDFESVLFSSTAVNQ